MRNMGMTSSSHAHETAARHAALGRRHVSKAQRFAVNSSHRHGALFSNVVSGSESQGTSSDGSSSETESCIDVELASPVAQDYAAATGALTPASKLATKRSLRWPLRSLRGRLSASSFREAASAPWTSARYYCIRNAPDALVELSVELVILVLSFFSPEDQHVIAATALCRRQRDRVRDNRDVWLSLCTASPWRVNHWAMTAATSARQLQHLHGRLLGALAKITRAAASVFDVAETMADFSTLACACIQRACLKQLVELLHDEKNRKMALRAQVTSLVVAALEKYHDNAELQSLALHCVVFLARPIGGSEGMVFSPGMDSMSLDAFLDGGIKAVLRAMATHSRCADVQAMGCWSLVNLALNRQQKIRLLELDGIDRVLDAMTIHPADEEVQFRALFALINLVIPEGRPGVAVSESTNRRVIGAVLTAMNSFPDSEKLVRCGCLVLHNTSLRESTIPFLLAAGVAAPLVRASREHADEDVRRSATSTLRRLGVQSDYYRQIGSRLPVDPQSHLRSRAFQVQ